MTEVVVASNKVGALSERVDLTNKSPQEKRKEKHKFLRDLSANGPAGATKQGNNMFPPTDGEIMFTPMFVDDDNKRILETHRGLRSKVVSNCLASNILLPSNRERIDKMTTSKLNQFVGDADYRVRV